MSKGTFIPVNTTNKFRDKQNRQLTLGLFKETCFNDNLTPVYTLNDEDKDGYPSAKKIYLEQRDPTEYRAAIALVGSQEHWKRLCECEWFQPYLEDWRKELDTLLVSEALSAIVNIAKQETSTGLAAAKFLAEKGWKEKNKNTKGRPSKDDIQREAKIQASIQANVDQHLKLLKN